MAKAVPFALSMSEGKSKGHLMDNSHRETVLA